MEKVLVYYHLCVGSPHPVRHLSRKILPL